MTGNKISGIKISEKGWVILKHFIAKESELIEKFLQKDSQTVSESPDHFLTYPGEIESSMADMNRVTATTVCRTFLEMDILDISKIDYTHKRGPKSVHYSLKSDLNTIRKLVKLTLEYLPYPEAQELLDNYYFTYNLNESLVREVLNEKAVCIKRNFSIVDWDVEDAQHIIVLFETNDSENRKDRTDFSSLLKDAVNECEQNNKDTDKRHITRLNGFCEGFIEAYKGSELKNMDYYFRDSNLINIMFSKNNDFIYNSESNIFFKFEVDPLSSQLNLPVFNDGYTELEKIEKIKELNIDAFYFAIHGNSDYLTPRSEIKKEINNIIQILENFIYELSRYDPEISNTFEKLSNQLHDFKSTIVDKYKVCYACHDFRNLIKDTDKIHIQICDYLTTTYGKNSEVAIDETLNGIKLSFEHINKQFEEARDINELKTQYIQNYYHTLLNEHYDTFEYEKLILPLLALIQASPLALDEFLNGDWEHFEFSLYERGRAENSEFLTKLIHIAFLDLMCRPRVLEKGIVDGVSFNSYLPSNVNHYEIVGLGDHKKYNEYIRNLHNKYYEELSYDRLSILEGPSLKIRLKQIYELTFYLSFNVTTKEAASKISSSYSFNIIPDIEFYFFRTRSLKNSESLISKLRMKEEPYNHIRSLLSRKMQNIIMYCDLSTSPSLKLKEDLLKELNFVLLKSELYKKGIFDNLTTKDEKIKEDVQNLSNNKVCLKDLIQMVHEEPLYNLRRGILTNNKRLFEKVFEDEFELDYPF